MLIFILSFVVAFGLTALFGWLMALALPGQLWIGVLMLIGIYIAFYVVFFGLELIMSFFFKKEAYEKTNGFYRFWLIQTMEILCIFGNVSIKAKGRELIPKDKKYLLVYNHRSNFDNIIMGVKLPNKNFIHISKPGNFKIPIAGPFIKRNCYMSLNREDPREGVKTIKKAAAYISDNKFSVGVAPEGTRNKSGEGLLPFRDGAFKIALFAKCPIVVVTLFNTEKIHKNFPFKHTKTEIHVCEVMEYDDYKEMNTQEISEHVRSVFVKDLGIKEGNE